MNSHIAALWAKAFVHIAKLSEIVHTDRIAAMNAQVEAKLARDRLGHLITHVSESQASADEDEFRRLHWIEQLAEQMANWLDTVSDNRTWFANTGKAFVTKDGKPKAFDAMERIFLNISQISQCCRVDEVVPAVCDEPALSPEELIELSRLVDIETMYGPDKAHFFRDALDKQKEDNLSDRQAAKISGERYTKKLSNSPYTTFNTIKKWVRDNRATLRSRLKEEKCKSCNPVA